MKFQYAVGLVPFVSSALANPVSRAATSTSAVLEPEHTSDPEPVYSWSDGWETKFPIHRSCNSTLRAQLEEALDETVQLAQHARDHILRFGNSSDLVQKYFGNGTTSIPVGWYDRVVAADKSDMLFRCDDPDRNCETQDAWAGHHRGENATAETVICDLSFEIRRPLSSVCNLGYTVAESALNTYWATDLLHRVFHVPIISEDKVSHYTEDYAEVISLAKEDPDKSGYDSDTLQYFAIEAWAYDIAAPGVGCPGKLADSDEEEKPTATSTSKPTATSTAKTECHTHDDGTEHCT
ncbi:metallopeptidase [Geosmithia morbida]|uniref:Metallopeptidase n=1 Tax=Geosmithia morbida TaxID=1094350 RepID=A0A9P4Z3V2_9HYPO|nr:metallopeptidase [Geosmithia morbida]KAF4126967.1 metallopeptidase [Geosmithia morbida]